MCHGHAKTRPQNSHEKSTCQQQPVCVDVAHKSMFVKWRLDFKMETLVCVEIRVNHVFDHDQKKVTLGVSITSKFPFIKSSLHFSNILFVLVDF